MLLLSEKGLETQCKPLQQMMKNGIMYQKSKTQNIQLKS